MWYWPSINIAKVEEGDNEQGNTPASSPVIGILTQAQANTRLSAHIQMAHGLFFSHKLSVGFMYNFFGELLSLRLSSLIAFDLDQALSTATRIA